MNPRYDKVEKLIQFVFCIDANNGNIFLLEQETEQIHVFSKQGKLINDLTMDYNGTMFSPIALAVTSNSGLLVKYSEPQLVLFSY